MGKPRDLANVVATGNILADGAVAPAELTGVTSTAAEINILDGVTATAAELNLLDGVTATTAELNHVDGVTSNVQTQIDTKAPVAGPTFTGTATAPTVNASTALQIGGAAITATAAELNKMDGVTVSASDINTVTAKAPAASPTFTGDVTLPESIIHTGDTDTKLQFNANDSFRVITGDEERFKVNNGEVIINDNSVDMDFRVESNGDTHALFVQGSSGNIGLGTSSPARILQVDSTTNRVASFRHTDGSSAYVTFSDSSTTDDGSVRIGAVGNDLVNFVGGAERFRFGTSGQLGIGGATYGTSGQVLTSGGASAAPTWADAGGGAYEKIVETNVSSAVSAINFAGFSASEEQLLLIINDAQLQDANTNMRLIFKDSSGNDLTSNSDYYYHAAGALSSGGGFAIAGSATNARNMNLTPNNNINNAKTFSLRAYIYGWGTATPQIHYTMVFSAGGSSGSYNYYYGFNFFEGTATPARIKLYLASGGNISKGDFYLYKLA